MTYLILIQHCSNKYVHTRMNKKCTKWGDFNAHCSEATSYIEYVDNLIQRSAIDTYSMRNGDLLIDLLVDTNACIVSGRIGSQDFTNINSDGKSVVDYIIMPYEQLHSISSMKVHTVTGLINVCELQGYFKVPDHSLLEFPL